MVVAMLLALVSLPLAIPAWGAPIQPPFHVLYDPLSVLMVGTLIEKDEGRLVFRREETLHGEQATLPETVELRAVDWVVQSVSVAERYLVGYMAFSRDPQRARTMIVNPAGPHVLVSPGLEPALYPDTDEYRRFLAYGKGGHLHGRADAVPTLLAALKSGEAPIRVLAAAQIALDPGVQTQLDRAAVGELRAVVTDADMPWSSRHWLYDLASRKPEVFGRRWLRRTTRSILAEAPVTGYAHAVNAGDLVGAAFLQADLNQWNIPEAALARWLRSDSPAMAERALVQMRRQDTELEQRHLAAALADPGVPENTRKFLLDHQRRLERIHARQHGGRN
jgi:hypothetical protein